jgi:hypothetical protein
MSGAERQAGHRKGYYASRKHKDDSCHPLPTKGSSFSDATPPCSSSSYAVSTTTSNSQGYSQEAEGVAASATSCESSSSERCD